MIFFSDLRIIVDIFPFILNIYQLNSKLTARDYDLCSNYSKYCEWIVKLEPTLYIVSMVLIQMPSCIVYLKTGLFHSPYGLDFPGLDTQNWAHVFWLFLFFNISVGTGVLCLATYESFICILFVNIWMTSKIIEQDLTALKNSLEHCSEGDIKKSLLKIIQLHVEYNK